MDHDHASAERYEEFHAVVVAHSPPPRHPGRQSAVDTTLELVTLQRWTALPGWLQMWALAAAKIILLTVAWVERQMWALDSRLPWSGMPDGHLRLIKPPLFARYEYDSLPSAFPLLPLSCIYTLTALSQAINAVTFLAAFQAGSIPKTWRPDILRSDAEGLWSRASSEVLRASQRRICCNLWNTFTECLMMGGVRSLAGAPIRDAHFYEAPDYHLLTSHPAPFPAIHDEPQLDIQIFKAALAAICHRVFIHQTPNYLVNWVGAIKRGVENRPGGWDDMSKEDAMGLLLELEAIYCQAQDWQGNLPLKEVTAMHSAMDGNPAQSHPPHFFATHQTVRTQSTLPPYEGTPHRHQQFPGQYQSLARVRERLGRGRVGRETAGRIWES
ncbi:hypothetical protein JCM11641_005984 [Rhodosporidiobolus odoratus]